MYSSKTPLNSFDVISLGKYSFKELDFISLDVDKNNWLERQQKGLIVD